MIVDTNLQVLNVLPINVTNEKYKPIQDVMNSLDKNGNSSMNLWNIWTRSAFNNCVPIDVNFSHVQSHYRNLRFVHVLNPNALIPSTLPDSMVRAIFDKVKNFVKTLRGNSLNMVLSYGHPNYSQHEKDFSDVVQAIEDSLRDNIFSKIGSPLAALANAILTRQTNTNPTFWDVKEFCNALSSETSSYDKLYDNLIKSYVIATNKPANLLVISTYDHTIKGYSENYIDGHGNDLCAKLLGEVNGGSSTTTNPAFGYYVDQFLAKWE